MAACKWKSQRVIAMHVASMSAMIMMTVAMLSGATWPACGTNYVPYEGSVWQCLPT